MYMSRLTKQAVSSWDAPIVSTSGGKVRGVAKENGLIFRGVPYGRAERFADPRPAEDTGTLFLADHYTCACPELLTPLPEKQYMEPRFFLPQDEECLNMTVWTPDLRPEKPMPVLVWLGADGWERGWANELFASDGENLSSYGNVVVVAVNHRLNVLGTLRLTKEFAACPREGSPGLADLVLALKWIRNNAGAFGGDADHVTLFAQAKGGQKILDLMHTPAADGFYHQAVISGMEPPHQASVAELSQVTGLTLEQMGTDDPRTLPYWFLAEHVLDALARYKAVTGSDYVWSAVPAGWGCENTATTEGGGAGFMAECGETEWARKVPMLVSTGGAPPAQVLEFVRHRRRDGSGTWLYEFSFSSPLYGAGRTWNGAELPFWFHNADYLEGSYVPGVTEELQDRMAKALIDFLRTGSFQMMEELT